MTLACFLPLKVHDELVEQTDPEQPLEARGVAVEDGRWGYLLMIVRDPDGNELFFPYPADGQPD